jgi:hypothetical protein
MNADLLARVGAALYGPQWQSALARDLGVSDRTMRRWATGERAPERIQSNLLALVNERGKTLAELAKTLA